MKRLFSSDDFLTKLFHRIKKMFWLYVFCFTLYIFNKKEMKWNERKGKERKKKVLLILILLYVIKFHWKYLKEALFNERSTQYVKTRNSGEV